jgi:hypothetical protein
MKLENENRENFKNLKDVILGQYTPGENIEIFHGNAICNNEFEITTIHESYHYQLCNSTTFGASHTTVHTVLVYSGSLRCGAIFS